jgi:DNA repair exonuclease SbcCD ATPase subunit|tara:strand:+ start:1349 stop:3013 length:1665 start_codon:yes stop_codon:yes gene_type:complete
VPTVIYLDRSPSTVITGENGAGKSTILDALTFGLFGKPFRKINKPQLMNTINDKDLEVEIEFSIGKVEYLIKRGMKPYYFEIYKNGKMLDQPGSVREYQIQLENQILKLNYKSFTQIVILGNASFTPFMQLSTRDRREVIEDLLDIQIFSTMNTLLRDRVSDNKRSLTEVNYSIDLIQEKIEVQEQYLNKVKKDAAKQVNDLKDEIEGYRESHESAESLYSSLTVEVDTLLGSISSKDKVEKKSKKVDDLLSKLKDKSAKANKRVDFFEKNDNCPTCEQIIDLEIKHQKVKKTVEVLEKTKTAISELNGECTTLNEEMHRINNIQHQIQDAQNKIRDCNTQMGLYTKSINSLEGKIEEANNQDSVDSDSESKLASMNSDLVTYSGKKKTLVEGREVFEIAAAMLKDGGIKSKIIKQYVPVINKLVNKYLSALDFFVNFELDEEFNEVIKSRHRDEFSYASFSEGEKTRIDIALLLTWRAIAKLKNSTNTNLLILDEVFDNSLDLTGTDELTKLLNDMSDTNVFIITHTKGDVLTDKFRSQIRFEKVKSFSRIAP